MRLAAAPAIACLLLAATATASGERTAIVHRAWHVELNWSGERQAVEPGGTFTHCPGDQVSTLYFSGKMVHPSRRHVDYTVTWSHDHVFDASLDSRTKRHGRIRQSYGIEGIPGKDRGFADGTWTAAFQVGYVHQSPIGKSSIELKTATGPGC